MAVTVGHYIKNILDERHISFSELSNNLGLKSRSALYRFFNDNCSVKRTRQFIDEIKRYVNFTDDEIKNIENLIDDDSVNAFYKKTRSVLKSLCRDKLKNGYVIKNDDSISITLSGVLHKYSEYKTDVFISEIDDEKIIGDIYEWLSYDHSSKLHCYYRFKHHRLQTAYELLSVIALSRFSNFYPCECDCMMYKGLCILAQNNEEYYLVSIYIDDNETHFLETTITKPHYEYMINNHVRLEEKMGYLRKSVSKVSEFIEYCECLSNNEYGDIYHFEGAPCFGNLSFDILYEMFEKINFFGFPKDHVYVKRLISIVKDRYANMLNNSGLKKIFVFDYQNLKHMMQTGISFDHIDEFEPMTAEQTRRYFNSLYDTLCNNSDRIKCRFYKNERICFPYVYKKSGVLSLYYSSSGSADNYSILLLNSGVIDIMDDFTKYMWDEYTISETSSLRELKSMMDKYL